MIFFYYHFPNILFFRIIHEVMNNEFIVEEIKINIMKARKAGHFGEECGHYPCHELDKQRMEGKEEESG